MKISYLVTCCNETDTLDRLLAFLEEHHAEEIIVLFDIPPSQATLGVVQKYMGVPGLFIKSHALAADYGAHKNYGNSQCTGDWVFQIDGDELPSKDLMDNLETIIESNPNVELIFVPRINDFRGVTPEHAKQWGWRLTPSPHCNNRPVVNWPDHQGRIYRRVPERIKWDRKLHEKIEGHREYSFLPADEGWALYHDKTIEKQMETNVRYNKVFTEADNKGHSLV